MRMVVICPTQAMPANMAASLSNHIPDAGKMVRDTYDIIQRAREALQKIDDLCPNPTADDYFTDVEAALDLAERLQRDNESLVRSLHEAHRPIGWQDVRLAVGEGSLTNNDVLNGVNAELCRRQVLGATECNSLQL